MFLTQSPHLFIFLSFFFFFWSDFICIRYKICINQSAMEASLWRALCPLVIYRYEDPEVLSQPYVPAEHWYNKRSRTQQLPRTEGISKGSSISQLREQHFTTGHTANTQATTRGNQIFEQEESDAFQSCVKENPVNKNYTMPPWTCP